MAFFSLQELLDIVIMIGAVAFIFKDSFVAPRHDYDPLRPKLNLEPVKLAIIVTAPAIAFHEMAHKFVSIAIGIPATFHASYFWLVIGVVLKLMSFPFIFFVPGYVSHLPGTPFENAIIAFAGPAMNLILWLGSAFLLSRKMPSRWKPALYMTKQINMFLFIFNMIPIPPFDGARVLAAILTLF